MKIEDVLKSDLYFKILFSFLFLLLLEKIWEQGKKKNMHGSKKQIAPKFNRVNFLEYHDRHVTTEAIFTIGFLFLKYLLLNAKHFNPV